MYRKKTLKLKEDVMKLMQQLQKASVTEEEKLSIQENKYKVMLFNLKEENISLDKARKLLDDDLNTLKTAAKNIDAPKEVLDELKKENFLWDQDNDSLLKQVTLLKTK